MRWLRMFKSLLVLALLLNMIVPPLRAQNEAAQIGTFDRTAVVIAFYRSPLWAETLNKKTAERDRAKQANDIAKVEELNAWGSTSQEQAHKQLAGEAPITNIIEALQPAFAEIKRTARVSQVVPAPYQGKAETLDITNSLLDWLKADEPTRQTIREIQK